MAQTRVRAQRQSVADDAVHDADVCGRFGCAAEPSGLALMSRTNKLWTHNDIRTAHSLPHAACNACRVSPLSLRCAGPRAPRGERPNTLLQYPGCGALEHCRKSSTLWTVRRPRDRCGCGLLVRWGRSCSSFRTGERRRAPSGPQRAARAFSRRRSQRVGRPSAALRPPCAITVRRSTAPRIACTAEGAGPQSILRRLPPRSLDKDRHRCVGSACLAATRVT